jgi:transcriptional antiterminator NusG
MDEIEKNETNEKQIELDNHKWYVINTVIGQERKIVGKINEEVEKRSLHTLITEVLIPCETVSEMKRGKKVDVERKVCPGYILVKMEMNDKTLSLIRGISGVAKFLGRNKQPISIPEREVKRMMDHLTEVNVIKANAATESSYIPGDVVEIKEGAFEGFTACVETVDMEKMKITVSVSIFGRETPVELDFKQAVRIQQE